MSRFLRELHSGNVLLMDGAMGTELLRAGVRPGECFEAWNLLHPERVRAVHQAYKQAGARVFLTNTFQANPANLSRHGMADRLPAIVAAGISLAREVARKDDFVLLDVGPATEVNFLESCTASLNDCDGVLLETWSAPEALTAARQCSSLFKKDATPILLSLTYRRDDAGVLTTHSGHEPEFFAERAREHGVAAVGVNCGREIGIADIVQIIRRYRTATDVPLFARPNAGTPRQVADRLEYPLTPALFAEKLPELLENGLAMIGGCCGTGPDHVAALGFRQSGQATK